MIVFLFLILLAILFPRFMRFLLLGLCVLILFAWLSVAKPAELTCEPAALATRAHCWDAHGYLSTEERSGEYLHGHDNAGRSWMIWEHNGRSIIIERK